MDVDLTDAGHAGALAKAGRSVRLRSGQALHPAALFRAHFERVRFARFA